MLRLWGVSIRYQDGGNLAIFTSRTNAEAAYQEWKEAVSPGGMAESLIEIEGVCNTAMREPENLAFIANAVVSVTIWQE